jgi:hypothetical protein
MDGEALHVAASMGAAIDWLADETAICRDFLVAALDGFQSTVVDDDGSEWGLQPSEDDERVHVLHMGDAVHVAMTSAEAIDWLRKDADLAEAGRFDFNRDGWLECDGAECAGAIWGRVIG